jgi:hypothetical protein
MENKDAFGESKWNDEYCMLPYMKDRWSGKVADISWHVTLDESAADFAGSDIECIDWFASDQMRNNRGRYIYDTKYLRKPYAWFPLEKFMPDGTRVEIITTNYIYVWKNIAVMFPRSAAVELCNSKAYAIRDRRHNTGYVSRICTIPKQDLMSLGGFVVLGKYWKNGEQKPSFIDQYGPMLKGELENWEN